MTGFSLRAALGHGALLLGLLFAAGCASSSMTSAYSMASAYPETARLDQVRGMDFYSVCHGDRAMRIPKVAVGLHLQHGDSFGTCDTPVAQASATNAPEPATTAANAAGPTPERP